MLHSYEIKSDLFKDIVIIEKTINRHKLTKQSETCLNQHMLDMLSPSSDFQ